MKYIFKTGGDKYELLNVKRVEGELSDMTFAKCLRTGDISEISNALIVNGLLLGDITITNKQEGKS